MNQDHATTLAQIEAELARQDAEWSTIQQELESQRESELEVSNALLTHFEEATAPAAMGMLPIGFVRA